MTTDDSPTGPAAAENSISEHDILFECPNCGKSLIVDGSAEGMIIDCPRCDTNVIVPPRGAAGENDTADTTPSEPAADMATPAAADTEPPVAETDRDIPPAGPDLVVADLNDQLADLANKMREVQTQWADTTNRIATRINEVNRELVGLGRLESSHKELLQKWNGLIARLAKASEEITKPLPPPPGA